MRHGTGVNKGIGPPLYCLRMHPILKELNEKYESRGWIIFLTSITE